MTSHPAMTSLLLSPRRVKKWALVLKIIKSVIHDAFMYASHHLVLGLNHVMSADSVSQHWMQIYCIFKNSDFFGNISVRKT